MDELSNYALAKLSEATTKKAFEDRDWPALRSHLDEVGLEEPIFDALLGHLRRASGFILRRPNHKQEHRRDAFLNELLEYVRLAKGEVAVTRVVEVTELLLHAERGYREILQSLVVCDISKLAPEIRAAAHLRRAASEYIQAMKQLRETQGNSKQFTVPNNPTVEDADGRSISMDAVIDAIVTALSSSLAMESHTNYWHDARGVITLPALPSVGDAEIFQAGSTQELAIRWRQWQRTEERGRFLSGTLERSTAPDLPSWAPPDASRATQYTPDETEFFDYAANQRVLDRLGQQFMEMMTETRAPEHVSGIAGPLPLIPAGVVSLNEFHAAAALGDILKYEITEDTERPCGLRILEWLRGYAVLQQLASDSYELQRTEAGLITLLPRAELLSIFERCGLEHSSAEHFLEHATLKVSSDDLFDSPLIRLHDGSLIVFGPALLTTNLTIVVLSMLATLQASLSKRGRSLEAALVTFLQKHQLHARAFRVSRDGQEYEFDTILVWGDYVFVFECKNRSLSSNRPVNTYYFELGIRSAVRQVQRLAEALRKHADILEKEMNVARDSKTIIPCVLNSLPYARTGDLDGVFCTDWSIIERFFSDRYIFLKSPHRVQKNMTVLHRVAVASQWERDQPGPEDLLKHLRDPIQLKLLKAHTEVRWGSFAVGPNHVVAAADFTRTPSSIESITAALGVSSAVVQGTLDAVRRITSTAKQRADKKTKRKARKPK